MVYLSHEYVFLQEMSWDIAQLLQGFYQSGTLPPFLWGAQGQANQQ